MGARLYFKADKELSAKIAEMWKDAEQKVNAGRKLARRHGATDCYISAGLGSRDVTGFAFKEPPDAKVFCRLKNTSDGWKPRCNKAGKPIRAEMETLRTTLGGDVAKLIGMNIFHAGGDGIMHFSPGVTMVGSVAYISVPEHVTHPKNCIRISDLEYERKTAPVKGKKKKATA